MRGGAKRKKIETGNTLQQIISAKLRQLYNMNDFIKRDEGNMVANTYGVVCPHCHIKDQIYAETVQTRSGDEAADRICVCLKCGHRWKIHGG